ncbi:MAG: SpoIID/LytB domain-containing protein, partial [Peptococcaceae bacterium]|nr:SpoIID/LytB domain-containing protein [Peptococcaceae bacterium]
MLRAGKTTLLRLSIFIIAGILFSGYFPSPAEARAEDLARIRVCLAQSLQIQEFEVQGNYDLVDEEGKIISKVAAGENWKVEYVEEGLKFFKGDILELSSKDPVSLLQEGKTITAVSVSGSVGLIVDKKTSVVSSGNQVSFLSGSDSINTISKNGTGSIGFQEELKLVKLLIGGSTQSYRGDLEFRSEGSGIMLVNSLPLEEYLYSVVPGEMPASWQLEALKAQAVAARTYALVKKNSANNNIYDVLPTTANQVYKGYNSENASSSRAVSETRGQVLEYLDQPITAFFHSSSGGFLESSQDVWSTRLEYFEDKPDPYDQNDSHYDWTVNYTQEQLVQQLNKGLFSQQDADSEERLKAVQDIE